MIFDPTHIADLARWLDWKDLSTLFQNTAGTTAVTTDSQQIKCIKDKSGFGGHATEATNPPTYSTAGINGVPCATFNGSQKLTVPDFFGAGYDTALSVYLVSSGGVAGANKVVIGFSDSSWFDRNGSSGQNEWRFNGLNSPTTPSGAQVLNAPNIDSASYNGTNLRLSSVSNGIRMPRVSGEPPYYGRVISRTGNLGLTSGLTIGNLPGGGFGWVGQVGELIVVNRYVSEPEDRDIQDYLSDKWKIANKPYLLCCGDSLTDGFYVADGDSYPQKLQTLLGSDWIVDRDSYGGRFLGPHLPDNTVPFGAREFIRSVYWRSWQRASSYQQYIAMWFTNDFGSVAEATVRAYYVESCQRMMSAGLMPIAVTVTPRGIWSAQTLAYVATFNAYIRANWPSFAVGLWDLAADSRLTDPNNLTYFLPDTVHYNAAGNDVIAGIAAAHMPSVLFNDISYSFSGVTDDGPIASGDSVADLTNYVQVATFPAPASGSVGYDLKITLTNLDPSHAIVVKETYQLGSDLNDPEGNGTNTLVIPLYNRVNSNETSVVVSLKDTGTTPSTAAGIHYDLYKVSGGRSVNITENDYELSEV